MNLRCIYNIISGNTINLTILASVLEILYGVDLVIVECLRNTLSSCIKYVRSC